MNSKTHSFREPITPLLETENEQIRGIAMALRHWFDVQELESEQRRAGLLPSEAKARSYDRSLRVLAISALPPQLVRLKKEAPIHTLHFMQDVYDDGRFRADPWRWWFAWVAIEIIARLGPDDRGEKVGRFVREDPSLEAIRHAAPRWLAANGLRLDLVTSVLRDQLDGLTATETGSANGESDGRASGRTIDERLSAVFSHLETDLAKAMSNEAASVSASITLRLRERVKRST